MNAIRHCVWVIREPGALNEYLVWAKCKTGSFNEKSPACAPLLLPLMSRWYVAVFEMPTKKGNFWKVSAEDVSHSEKSNNLVFLGLYHIEGILCGMDSWEKLHKQTQELYRATEHVRMTLGRWSLCGFEIGERDGGNMKGFCRYFSSKRSREGTSPTLNMARNLERINTEEAKVLMVFSSWSLLKNNCLQQFVKTVGDARAWKMYPCWRVRLDHLETLEVYKPWSLMGCSQNCRDSCSMWLPGLYRLSWKDHDDGSHSCGVGESKHHFSGHTGKKIWGNTGQLDSPQSLWKWWSR